MKKLLLVSICTLAGFATAFSQNVFKEGDKVVNLGIGIGTTLYSGSGYSTTIPPVSASFEYGVKDNLFDEKSSLGVGAFIGYAANDYKLPYSLGKLEYTNLIVGVRGALHYEFVEKLDTYAGISLGYNIVSNNASNEVSSVGVETSSFFTGFYLGGRYYFTDKLAAMAEVGYDISALRLGIAYKF